LLWCCANDGGRSRLVDRSSGTLMQKQDGMDNVFERALAATGPEYVELERQLRRLVAAGTSEALAAIAAGRRHPDPIAPLLAEVVGAARGESGQDYDNLEKLMVNFPARVARTPLGEPEPDMFRQAVTRAYGGRATKFLALRLVKQPEWPDWLVLGVLLYLQEHPDPATTAAVLRFAIVTPSLDQRRAAVATLGAIADPAMGPKVVEAQRWAEAAKLPFPPELRR
jgi:hypothetical protein